MAFAKFCYLTKANPMIHIDVLGGGPYLNAEYWSDKMNSDPTFIRYEQFPIDRGTEAKWRERAKRLRAQASELKDLEPQRAADFIGKAQYAEDKADWVEEQRIQWEVPDAAPSAYLTDIYKFGNHAPLEKIRSGEIQDFDRYVVKVSEANWAGNKSSDPVGKAEAEKTARTRSLRRAGVRAFSAWLQQYEQEISKVENAMEAEFEIIMDERAEERASLPSSDEPQAVSTSQGEPSVAQEDEAQDLPSATDPAVEEDIPAPEISEEEQSLDEPEPFDRGDWHRKYFALLKEAGIDERKPWQVDNFLPESVTEWEPHHYKTACRLLEEIVEGARA